MIRTTAALLCSLVATAALAATADASTAVDLRGTWGESSVAGATYTSTVVFGDENFATGAVTGRGSGGGYTWPEAVTLTGNAFDDVIGPYDQLPSYSSHATGTVAADGNSISATFRDSNGTTGTFFLTRLSGGTTPTPTPTPGPTPDPGHSIDYGQGCTNATTLLVTCANPNGLPGICGPTTGTILPQCSFPVELPTVCGPTTGTILAACHLPTPAVVACGGIGTILPQCNAPSSPIVVCGPSGTILPQCSFTTRINSAVIDVPPDGGAGEKGTIDLDASCPTPLASARAAGAAWHAAKAGGGTCDCDVVVQALREQKAKTLAAVAQRLSDHFVVAGELAAPSSGRVGWDGVTVLVNGVAVELDYPLTDAQAKAFGAANAEVFRARVAALVDRYFVADNLPPVPSPEDVETILSARVGNRTYVGPEQLSFGSLTGNADIAMAQQFVDAYAEYRELVKATRSNARTAPAAQAAASAAPARLVEHMKLRRGKHRIRIRLSHSAVRALLRQAGKRAKVVPVRIVVAFTAKPRPVVRFVDVPVRIRRR